MVLIPQEGEAMTTHSTIKDLANRLYNLDVYGARNEDETPETIAETLTHDPLAVVEYLLNMIDDLTT